ncbi:hypothetical protein ACTXT7_015426 [Hymenolepis weldensis]
MFVVNLAKGGEKTRVRCLVRKLGPVVCEFYSKFFLPKDFDELIYSETALKTFIMTNLASAPQWKNISDILFSSLDFKLSLDYHQKTRLLKK